MSRFTLSTTQKNRQEKPSLKIFLAARVAPSSWSMSTDGENITRHPLPKRFLQFDLARGFILWWMSFANAYFALSQTQHRWLSHDTPVMSPADLIAVFFLLMIGLNLALVTAFKNKSPGELLQYALKRGAMLILIGAGLISYSLVFFKYDITVIFRSVLVILGIAMILTAVFIYFSSKYKKLPLFIVIAATLVTLFALHGFTPGLPAGLRFLSPWFLLTSFWGYLLGRQLLQAPQNFSRQLAAFGGASLIAGIFTMFFYKEVPTRLLINGSYIFFSWAAVSLSLALLWRTWNPKNASQNPVMKNILLAGAHPLSFWIIQGLIIGGAVTISTWFYYQATHMEHYFWQAPAKIRAITDHGLAIIAATATAATAASAHLLFVKFYRRKKSNKVA